ncbi:MAG: CapA family protein [Actinobacteria bacterium]|nr:CapA family protein [Actinomycetota bacterium]
MTAGRRTARSRLQRRIARRQAVFLATSCLCLFLLVFLVFMATSRKEGGGETVTRGQVALPQEPDGTGEDTAAPGSITLALGGDVAFCLGVEDLVAGGREAYPWEGISSLLRDYDFTVVNLEGPLCRPGQANPDQDASFMRGDAACAPPMAEAGVDAVCLANDHVMDYGSPGLEQTLNILHGVGVSSVGAGPSLQAAEQPLVLKGKDGTRLALLAFCDVAPASYGAGESTPGIACADPARVSEAVARAVAENPYVVVFLHWGEVGCAEVSPRQRELAELCAGAGADLVVGCHPHLVQGAEMVEGTPVFYSLGNLVFSPRSEEGKRGILLGCRFSGGELAGVEIQPLLVEDGRPRLLPREEAEGFLAAFMAASPGMPLRVAGRAGSAVLMMGSGN